VILFIFPPGGGADGRKDKLEAIGFHDIVFSSVSGSGTVFAWRLPMVIPMPFLVPSRAQTATAS
jgi:hypothetical protein